MENTIKYGVVYILMILGIYFSAYEFNRVVEQLDKISDSVKSMELNQAHTADVLDNHEKRIEKLEVRR